MGGGAPEDEHLVALLYRGVLEPREHLNVVVQRRGLLGSEVAGGAHEGEPAADLLADGPGVVAVVEGLGGGVDLWRSRPSLKTSTAQMTLRWLAESWSRDWARGAEVSPE